MQKKAKEKTWADKLPEIIGAICKDYCRWPDTCDGEAELMESHCKICGVYSMLEELFDTEIRRLLWRSAPGNVLSARTARFSMEKSASPLHTKAALTARFSKPRGRRNGMRKLPGGVWWRLCLVRCGNNG